MRLASPKLISGDRVAVIGGGPAGSFFVHYLADLSRRVGLTLNVDIYEPKDFSQCGPKNCNHCGGIVSESLLQSLASDGVIIPDTVIQSTIATYALHTANGSVKIPAPSDERRIVAMFRGAGPTGSSFDRSVSFDKFLQDLTRSSGCNIIHSAVSKVEFDENGLPVVFTTHSEPNKYHLVVVAGGLSPRVLKIVEKAGIGFRAPDTTKASICEFHMSKTFVNNSLGDVMHVFLLDIPQIKFGAIIPKGDYVSVVLLGEKINHDTTKEFLNHPAVRRIIPRSPESTLKPACQCFPTLNVGSATKPYYDRLVVIGDCAVTKLYKNGIGSAQITAKSAASTAVLQGISKSDFKRNYNKTCRQIERDNDLGKQLFRALDRVKGNSRLEQVILEQVHRENQSKRHYLLSNILWDVFTGSANYKRIAWKSLNPILISKLLALLGANWWRQLPITTNASDYTGSKQNQIGRYYTDGEVVIKEGEKGNCMYVIQSGQVAVWKNTSDEPILIAKLGAGEFFGEMALFSNRPRNSTVVACGPAKIITVERTNLMESIQQDPLLALRILEVMSHRLESANDLIASHSDNTTL